MNLLDFRTLLYSRCSYTATPPTSTINRIDGYLNETQRELLGMPGVAKLRDGTMTITAAANRAETGLPPAVARVNAIVDRTNNHKLLQVTLSELRREDPSMNFIGSYPIRYANLGERQVQIQPLAATGLWAASSASADTKQTAYIETITTGGYSYRDSVTLMGSIRVPFGVTSVRTDHIDVEKFYVGAPAVGYVSLYDAAAAGNELARIEPGQTYSRYLTVAWHPVQTADLTLYVDYTRTIFDLINAFDEPLLPPDFHYVMARGALMREYEFIDDSRLTVARVEYERGKAALRSFVLNDGDRITSLRPIGISHSSLGSSFPADR